MKIITTTLAFLLLTLVQQAQVTWADDVAEILYTHCTACHRDGGIAPFSMMTYQGAVDNASTIEYVVQAGIMPPWSPDPNYQNFAHERLLSGAEITTIVDWIGGGTPEGDLNNAPPPPVYPTDGFIATPPSLEVQIPEYTSQASPVADDYVCFSLPLNLSTSKKLRAFEVVPGNPDIVHHCLLYIDESGNYPTDLSGFCVGPTSGLIGGYTPGAVPTVFPSDGVNFNLGVTIPASSNLVLAMHFPEGSAGQVDNTKVRLFFYDDAVNIREIYTEPIIENWTFLLPPGQITNVSNTYNGVSGDVSLLSVFPHMHLLGKNISSYGITPDGTTIPFIDIPQWNFEWQQFYAFQHLLHVPGGTSIVGEGAFDNSSANPNNPNNPPQMVFPGLNTSDEMFLIYFQYLDYVAGDELMDLDLLTTLPTHVGEITGFGGASIQVFPNPVEEQTTFNFDLERPSKVSLHLYNSRGQLIEKILNGAELPAGKMQFEWTPEASLAAGVYYYSARINGTLTSGALIKE